MNRKSVINQLTNCYSLTQKNFSLLRANEVLILSKINPVKKIGFGFDLLTLKPWKFLSSDLNLSLV